VATIAAAKSVVDLIRTVRNVQRAARLSHRGVMLGDEAAFVAARFVHQYGRGWIPTCEPLGAAGARNPR